MPCDAMPYNNQQSFSGDRGMGIRDSVDWQGWRRGRVLGQYGIVQFLLFLSKITSMWEPGA